MSSDDWQNLGPVSAFKDNEVKEALMGRKKIAISYRNGEFGVISAMCTHVGGPLGQGKLSGDYIVCPWHYWKFHRVTGKAEPGYEDAVPQYEFKVDSGNLYVKTQPMTKGNKKIHPPHALARPVARQEGPIRAACISTTAMDKNNPRYSTSDALLQVAEEYSKKDLACETRLIKLNELDFRSCEGFYSKGARACTWPCSITQMDKNDQLDAIYEALVHWADVIILATPIRWGVASALYFKMAERLNCIQNQVTIANNVLIRNKVASFIITGGQDNIQGVAGQLLTFFSELGFYFPQFPFIAHSRGWSAEDMERNIAYVQNNQELKEGAQELAKRSVETAKGLLKIEAASKTSRGGRKAHQMELSSN